jgi:hypothetical protein
MLPIVEFPTLVQHYAPFFKDVFTERALIEFERYISGLIVSENKTVEGINRLCVVENRNQSSLNRLLTQSPFRLTDLNQARLKIMAANPQTRIKPKGVVSLDDTLLSHYGQAFDQIAKLYDPVSDSYVWAHDLVSLHYSDELTDYPLAFQLWKPVDLEKLEAGMRAVGIEFKADKEALKTSAPRKWRSYLLQAWKRRQKQFPQLAELYDSKLTLAQTLLQGWVQEHPEDKLAVTFDYWYTQVEFCQFIDQTLHWPYVGTLVDKDAVILKTGKTSLGEFADHLKTEHQQALQGNQAAIFEPTKISYKGAEETYYSYCQTHHLDHFGKQRLVISYRQADLSDQPKFFISNRLTWQAAGILHIRRHRWPVEVYYEEGKAEGLDAYQLRDFEAIQRHVALVAVVYSLLRAAQRDRDLQQTLQQQLKITLEGSAAFWCRASQAQALWCLGLLIRIGLTQGQSLQQILAPVIQAMCPSA